MFMRFVELKINPKHIAEFKDFYENVVTKELRNTDGCMFAGLIKSDPQNSEFISLTFWQSQKHAEEYETNGKYEQLIQKTKPYLSESNEWKVQLSDNFELEYKPVEEEPVIKKYSVAVQNGEDKNVIPSSQNMYVRILSIKIEENKLEEFKKLYSVIILPSLKETEGCRNAFLIESINQLDEFISVSIWDSKEAADNYEASEKFRVLTERVSHTFSKLYLWKMFFEKEHGGVRVQTSQDFKIEHYDIVTGRSFS